MTYRSARFGESAGPDNALFGQWARDGREEFRVEARWQWDGGAYVIRRRGAHVEQAQQQGALPSADVNAAVRPQVDVRYALAQLPFGRTGSGCG
jgi:hypothetical protein